MYDSNPIPSNILEWMIECGLDVNFYKKRHPCPKGYREIMYGETGIVYSRVSMQQYYVTEWSDQKYKMEIGLNDYSYSTLVTPYAYIKKETSSDKVPYILYRIRTSNKHIYNLNKKTYTEDIFPNYWFKGSIHLIFKNKVALVKGTNSFYYFDIDNERITMCGNDWNTVVTKTKRGAKTALFVSDEYLSHLKGKVDV